MASTPQPGGPHGENRAGGDPLPISALPVPDDDGAPATPAPSLPTGKNGELSPAQRARLGLDVFGEQAQQPVEAASTGPKPLPVPDDQPAASQARAPNAAPTDFGFRQIDPFGGSPAGPNAVSQRVSPEELAGAANVAPQPLRQRSGSDDGIPELERDRSVLTYGVAWTLFAMLVSAGIAFSSSMSRATGEAAGPGPIVPALISIGIGWVIVFAARGMGRNWGYLMILPAVILFLGPFAYANYWSTSLEDSARGYLSPIGATSLIDVDQTSLVSETINTDRGCFAITRDRKTKDTEVAVVTLVPETARQQADFALAPRYAGRITAGGARSTQRVFTFKRGLGPAIVSEVIAAPLDCATSAAPASGS